MASRSKSPVRTRDFETGCPKKNPAFRPARKSYFRGYTHDRPALRNVIASAPIDHTVSVYSSPVNFDGNPRLRRGQDQLINNSALRKSGAGVGRTQPLRMRSNSQNLMGSNRVGDDGADLVLYQLAMNGTLRSMPRRWLGSLAPHLSLDAPYRCVARLGPFPGFVNPLPALLVYSAEMAF